MPFPRDGEDALEAWLRFPLHQVIGECHGWWRISPSQVKAKVTGRHKSRREGEGSKSRAAKGKTSQPVGKTPTPRARSKLVRELCNALPRVDGKDYHVIWVSSLLEHDPNTPWRCICIPLHMTLKFGKVA
ncbi:hypothetical protein GW17_00015505 [Ensete ventricosum]|nr:hypothetical protein GW17_00015505 [Ensete ventricosum]